MLTDNELNATTGGYFNAAPLQDIAGVNDAYAGLLAHVQALPFVPSQWMATVAAESAARNHALWIPRYAIRADAWNQGKLSPLLDDVPEWLHTPEAAKAWNTLTDWWKTRLQPILAGWGKDQAAIMHNANDEAAFWNTVYTTVKPVAVVGDTIIAAPSKVAEVASGITVGVLKKFWPVIAVVVVIGVGAVIFKNKMMKVAP
jgi:hypothetical protein